MTCREVQSALLGCRVSCLWDPRRVIAARNTVGVLGWEADLVLIQPSGWLWEVEVKVSASDFRREFRAKTKIEKHRVLVSGHHRANYRGDQKPNMVRKFFFAMPSEVYEQVKAEIPDYAGVILVDPAKTLKGWKEPRPWIEKKAKDLPAEKADGGTRHQVLLSIYHRHWSATWSGEPSEVEA